MTLKVLALSSFTLEIMLFTLRSISRTFCTINQHVSAETVEEVEQVIEENPQTSVRRILLTSNASF